MRLQVFFIFIFDFLFFYQHPLEKWSSISFQLIQVRLQVFIVINDVNVQFFFLFVLVWQTREARASSFPKNLNVDVDFLFFIFISWQTREARASSFPKTPSALGPGTKSAPRRSCGSQIRALCFIIGLVCLCSGSLFGGQIGGESKRDLLESKRDLLEAARSRHCAVSQQL